jgi:hypothetical protein
MPIAPCRDPRNVRKINTMPRVLAGWMSILEDVPSLIRLGNEGQDLSGLRRTHREPVTEGPAPLLGFRERHLAWRQISPSSGCFTGRA